MEDEHLQNQREDLGRDFGTELLIGRSVMQDSQGLTDEQAKALALITRDLSSLDRIIAEPAMQYPIRTNEAAATVGEELLTMERTARALQDVPESLRERGEKFPPEFCMREYLKHDVKVIRTFAEDRVSEFSKEINKFQKAKEKIRSLNELYNPRSVSRIK